jgi:threonine dehydratase
MPPYALPSPRDVEKAAFRIAKKLIQTPINTSSHLDSIASINASCCKIELFFKCENLQRTGLFKYRGASCFLA